MEIHSTCQNLGQNLIIAKCINNKFKSLMAQFLNVIPYDKEVGGVGPHLSNLWEAAWKKSALSLSPKHAASSFWSTPAPPLPISSVIASPSTSGMVNMARLGADPHHPHLSAPTQSVWMAPKQSEPASLLVLNKMPLQHVSIDKG
jgi:hypothetical protein